MMDYGSIAMTSGAASGVLPVDPGLAVLILIGALLGSAICLLLAGAPPSGLLRRVRLSRPERRSRVSRRPGTLRAPA